MIITMIIKMMIIIFVKIIIVTITIINYLKLEPISVELVVLWQGGVKRPPLPVFPL